MRTLQQAIDDCRDLCRQKWGDDWAKTVHLSVGVSVGFYRQSPNVPDVRFNAYADPYAVGHVYGKTTDDLVDRFRLQLELNKPEPADSIEACESVIAGVSAEQQATEG